MIFQEEIVLHTRASGAMHDLSEQVEDLLDAKLGGSAVVHIDPVNTGHRRYGEIRRALETLVTQDDRIRSFHDLRVADAADGLSVAFDITMKQDVLECNDEAIKQDLRRQLLDKLGKVTVAIKAEPRYAYTDDNESAGAE